MNEASSTTAVQQQYNSSTTVAGRCNLHACNAICNMYPPQLIVVLFEEMLRQTAIEV
jgi:hypothetical protein